MFIPQLFHRSILQHHFWIIEEAGTLSAKWLFAKPTTRRKYDVAFGQQSNVTPFRVLASNKASLSASSNKGRCAIRVCGTNAVPKMPTFEVLARRLQDLSWIYFCPETPLGCRKIDSKNTGKYLERATLAVTHIFVKQCIPRRGIHNVSLLHSIPHTSRDVFARRLGSLINNATE